MSGNRAVRCRALHVSVVAFSLLLAAVCPPRSLAGVNRWTAAGPTGGLVWHIAEDPSNPSVLYAATEGGPFKSLDDGESWQRLAGIFRVNGMDFGQRSFWMTVSPDRPDLVFAGTDRTLFLSETGGATWKYKSQGLPHSASVVSLAVDPLHPATVYAAAYWVGVFKSTDRGDTWSAAGTGLPSSDPEVLALAVDPQSPSTLYAALYGAGVFKTTDGARTWTRRSNGLTGNLFSLAMDPSAPATLYAGTDTGLFKTVDGGGTWSLAGTGLPAPATPYAIAVAPDDPDTVWAAVENQGVWRSDDGAANWGPRNEGLVGDLTSEVFWLLVQRGGTVLAATRAGIFKTTDGGGRWTMKNDGLVAAAVYAVETAANGAWYASTYGNGVSKSTDRGATWAPVNNGLTRGGASLWLSALAVDPAAPNTVYAAGRSGFFKTTDGGANWAPLPLAETGQSLLVDPTSRLTVYAGTNRGVFKSSDGGAGWQRLANGPARPVYSLEMRPGQPNVIFAGTDAGIFRSEDSGASWTFRGLPRDRIWAIAVDPRRPSVVYAVSDNEPFESTDGGETWRSIAQLQLPDSLWAATVHPRDSRFLAAGGDGVWEFHKPSWSWRLDNHGSLSARYVKSLQFDPLQTATLIAGIYGGGVATWSGHGLQWPNGKEAVHSGGGYLVQWEPTPGAHHYALDCTLDGGATWQAIAAGVTTTSYRWTVPAPRGNRRRCLIRLRSYDAAGQRIAIDESDAPFTVEVVQMDAPWAEETAHPGDRYRVWWHVNRTAAPVAKIEFSFSADGGQVWDAVAALPGDSRAHYVTVPNVRTDSGAFRVVLRDASGLSLGSSVSGLRLKIVP